MTPASARRRRTGAPARHESVVINADGGSRGNPGPAGYGAVVFAPDGTVLAERAASLGVVTNNVAEYSGLIAGLEAARDLGATTVTARMDSKLVVEQMSGRWKVKHPDMKPLAQQGFCAGRRVRPGRLRVGAAGRELARRPARQRGDGRGRARAGTGSAPELPAAVAEPSARRPDADSGVTGPESTAAVDR